LKGKRGIVKCSLGYVEEFLNEFDRNPISKENVALRYKSSSEIWEKYSEAQDELERF
jgi:hypothetical protein